MAEKNKASTAIVKAGKAAGALAALGFGSILEWTAETRSRRRLRWLQQHLQSQAGERLQAAIRAGPRTGGRRRSQSEPSG
jgi:hypothetical protein